MAPTARATEPYDQRPVKGSGCAEGFPAIKSHAAPAASPSPSDGTQGSCHCRLTRSSQPCSVGRHRRRFKPCTEADFDARSMAKQASSPGITCASSYQINSEHAKGASASNVRQGADQHDQSDADGQPDDLRRRLAGAEALLQLRNQVGQCYIDKAA